MRSFLYYIIHVFLVNMNNNNGAYFTMVILHVSRMIYSDAELHGQMFLLYFIQTLGRDDVQVKILGGEGETNITGGTLSMDYYFRLPIVMYALKIHNMNAVRRSKSLIISFRTRQRVILPSYKCTHDAFRSIVVAINIVHNYYLPIPQLTIIVCDIVQRYHNVCTFRTEDKIFYIRIVNMVVYGQ